MPIVKKSGFELHPSGVFEARLVSVDEAESLNPEWPDQFKCLFETEAFSESGQNLTIPYYVSQKLNDLSKLGALVKEMGFDLDKISNGQDFDTDELLGKFCSIVVEQHTRKDGTIQAKVISVSSTKGGRFSPPFENEESF